MGLLNPSKQLIEMYEMVIVINGMGTDIIKESCGGFGHW
jgi:hypothetical protein